MTTITTSSLSHTAQLHCSQTPTRTLLHIMTFTMGSAQHNATHLRRRRLMFRGPPSRKVLSSASCRSTREKWNLISNNEKTLSVCVWERVRLYVRSKMMKRRKKNKVNVTRSWNFFAGDYYTCNVITTRYLLTLLSKWKRMAMTKKNKTKAWVEQRLAFVVGFYILSGRWFPVFARFAANSYAHPEKRHTEPSVEKEAKEAHEKKEN